MSEWATVALGDAIDFFDSKRIPLSAMERAKRRGEFPYYGASGIIDWIDDYIFDGRYLLVAEDGENLNSRKLPVAFFAEGKFWVNNHAHIVRGKSDVLDDVFLQQWLLHADIGGYITGSAQPKLSQANMKRIHIGLPPLPTQRKIAAFLSGYDDLIDNNKRRIKLLEEMAQRIYREWFVEFRYPGHENVPLVAGKFGTIPTGWDWKHLGDLAAESRTSVEPGSVGAETPYVGLEHMPERSIAIADWGAAREAGSRKYRFKRGDVLFGKIRPYFHKVVVPPVDGICSTDAIVIRSRVSAHSGLVLAVVSSDAFVEEAVQTSQGTKMPRANWNVLERFPVAVAPSDLLEKFGILSNNTVPLIHRLVMANRNLGASRDLLLPHLISGEIDVTDLDIALPEAAA